MTLTTYVELFNRPGTARVDKAITRHQRGRVYFGGTYWPARFLNPDDVLVSAEATSHVTVVGRQGVTLLVAPLATVRTA